MTTKLFIETYSTVVGWRTVVILRWYRWRKLFGSLETLEEAKRSVYESLLYHVTNAGQKIPVNHTWGFLALERKERRGEPTVRHTFGCGGTGERMIWLRNIAVDQVVWCRMHHRRLPENWCHGEGRTTAAINMDSVAETYALIPSSRICSSQLSGCLHPLAAQMPNNFFYYHYRFVRLMPHLDT